MNQKETAKPKPDWVDQIPAEEAYELAMFGTDGETLPHQTVAMTREEFIAVKRFLAKRRGYIQ